MIFALRAVMVSLAFFAILYSLLSLVLVLAWKALTFFRLTKPFSARGLFTLRVIPFAIAGAVSLFLTLPSFLMLEAHSMDEDFATFALCLCGVLILAAGIYRVITAEARTRRVVSACMAGATDLEASPDAPAIVLPKSVTPLMLVGIRVPRILISESVCKLLSDAELRATLRHETEHFRSCDNLKKAILNCLPFPGMSDLEEAWQETSELAADNGAVSSREEALDLAAALIKLSRHFPCQAIPDLATGLVGVGSVAVRVERLLAWEESPAVSPNRWRFAVPVAVAAFLALVAKLGSALILIHSLTERLVP